MRGKCSTRYLRTRLACWSAGGVAKPDFCVAYWVPVSVPGTGTGYEYVDAAASGWRWCAISGHRPWKNLAICWNTPFLLRGKHHDLPGIPLPTGRIHTGRDISRISEPRLTQGTFFVVSAGRPPVSNRCCWRRHADVTHAEDRNCWTAGELHARAVNVSEYLYRRTIFGLR